MVHSELIKCSEYKKAYLHPFCWFYTTRVAKAVFLPENYNRYVHAAMTFRLNGILIEPLFLLFGSSLLPRAPRTHQGRIEKDPRRQRGQIERKCQKGCYFDCSSLHFPQTVTSEHVFSRKKYQTSHRLEEPVTSHSEQRHIFERTEWGLLYICSISHCIHSSLTKWFRILFFFYEFF